MLAVWANRAASMRMASELVLSQTKSIHGMKMNLHRLVYVRPNLSPALIAFHSVDGGRIHIIRVNNKVGFFHIALLYRRLANMGNYIKRMELFTVINHVASSFPSLTVLWSKVEEKSRSHFFSTSFSLSLNSDAI